MMAANLFNRDALEARLAGVRGELAKRRAARRSSGRPVKPGMLTVAQTPLLELLRLERELVERIRLIPADFLKT